MGLQVKALHTDETHMTYGGSGGGQKQRMEMHTEGHTHGGTYSTQGHTQGGTYTRDDITHVSIHMGGPR